MSDDEERAARRKAVFEQLNDNSEAIIKQSRNILIGVGSVAWTALISSLANLEAGISRPSIF